MSLPRGLAAATVALFLLACTDRERTFGDAGPIAIDSGPVDAAGLDGGGPGSDTGATADAGPAPIGSCLGACAGAAAPMCPGYDRAACQNACTTEEDAADEAGCGMEYRLYLGCQQSSGWGCDASNDPFTPDCDDQRAAWEACMGV